MNVVEERCGQLIDWQVVMSVVIVGEEGSIHVEVDGEVQKGWIVGFDQPGREMSGEDT